MMVRRRGEDLVLERGLKIVGNRIVGWCRGDHAKTPNGMLVAVEILGNGIDNGSAGSSRKSSIGYAEPFESFKLEECELFSTGNSSASLFKGTIS